MFVFVFLRHWEFLWLSVDPIPHSYQILFSLLLLLPWWIAFYTEVDQRIRNKHSLETSPVSCCSWHSLSQVYCNLNYVLCEMNILCWKMWRGLAIFGTWHWNAHTLKSNCSCLNFYRYDVIMKSQTRWSSVRRNLLRTDAVIDFMSHESITVMITIEMGVTSIDAHM